MTRNPYKASKDRNQTMTETLCRSTLVAVFLVAGLAFPAMGADPDPNASDAARQKYLDLLRGTKNRLETEKLLNSPIPAPGYPSPYYQDNTKPDARDRMQGQIRNRMDNARKTMPKPKPKPAPPRQGGGGGPGGGGGDKPGSDNVAGLTAFQAECVNLMRRSQDRAVILDLMEKDPNHTRQDFDGGQFSIVSKGRTYERTTAEIEIENRIQNDCPQNLWATAKAPMEMPPAQTYTEQQCLTAMRRSRRHGDIYNLLGSFPDRTTERFDGGAYKRTAQGHVFDYTLAEVAIGGKIENECANELWAQIYDPPVLGVEAGVDGVASGGGDTTGGGDTPSGGDTTGSGDAPGGGDTTGGGDAPGGNSGLGAGVTPVLTDRCAVLLAKLETYASNPVNYPNFREDFDPFRSECPVQSMPEYFLACDRLWGSATLNANRLSYYKEWRTDYDQMKNACPHWTASWAPVYYLQHSWRSYVPGGYDPHGNRSVGNTHIIYSGIGKPNAGEVRTRDTAGCTPMLRLMESNDSPDLGPLAIHEDDRTWFARKMIAMQYEYHNFCRGQLP